MQWIQDPSRSNLDNLFFGAESSVIQVAVQKYKDQDIQYLYNSARCPVWV